MQVQFRQGILRYDTNQSPPILSRTSLTAASIDLNVVDSPILVTFAHYNANYLIEETRTVVGAWGSGDVNSTNGPLPMNQTQYLYWDLNLSTGALTRGWTSLPWIYTHDAPLNPQNDLHWFDLSTNRMRVWRKPGPAPGYWQDVVRCFAGWYDSNAILNIYSPGSQVGITGSFEAGNIMLAANNAPLKQRDGTFATTASQLIIQQTSGQNVKFNAAVIFGEAAEPIPSFYMVNFLPNGRIQLARSGELFKSAMGIVTENLSTNEVGFVTTNGKVKNDQWMWSDEVIGSPIFLGPTGEIWLTPPIGGICQRIGEIFSRDAVNISIHQPIRLR